MVFENAPIFDLMLVLPSGNIFGIRQKRDSAWFLQIKKLRKLNKTRFRMAFVKETKKKKKKNSNLNDEDSRKIRNYKKTKLKVQFL